MKQTKPAVTAAVVSLWLLLHLGVASRAQAPPNTITLDNRSGESALVKIVGPTVQSVEVPHDQTRTVNVAAGEYYLLVRYGKPPSPYTYSKGDPFSVEQTQIRYSAITITLHKVIGGNYRTNPASQEEFEQAAVGSPTFSQPPGPGEPEQSLTRRYENADEPRGKRHVRPQSASPLPCRETARFSRGGVPTGVLAQILPLPGRYDGEVLTEERPGVYKFHGIALLADKDQTASINYEAPANVDVHPSDILVTVADPATKAESCEEILDEFEEKTGHSYHGSVQVPALRLYLRNGRTIRFAQGRLVIPIADPGTKQVTARVMYEFGPNATAAPGVNNNEPLWRGLKVWVERVQ